MKVVACIAYRVGVSGFDIARFGRGQITNLGDGILGACQTISLGKRCNDLLLVLSKVRVFFLSVNSSSTWIDRDPRERG